MAEIRWQIEEQSLYGTWHPLAGMEDEQSTALGYLDGLRREHPAAQFRLVKVTREVVSTEEAIDG